MDFLGGWLEVNKHKWMSMDVKKGMAVGTLRKTDGVST